MSVHWHAILTALFGSGTWGAGGNLIAWVICGAIGGGLLRAKLQAQHVAALAQAARHHKELLAQAEAHHQALKQHISAVADGPARGGAGSNPARSEGLPADGLAVPPSATTYGGI